MLKSRASRLLGHYEYEIIFPLSKVGASRKKSYITQTNLNTTFQEILEEVCKIQDYNPKDYELIYEGKKLDREVSIRKSGLPVSGVIDLVAGANVEKETSVNVALQLENGKRLAYKFDVQDSLWSVLQYWESQGENILQDKDGLDLVPVCNYLRQTITGENELKEKTLRSVGLTRGSGIIRLHYRAAETVGSQAGVSSQLTGPVNVISNKKFEQTDEPKERPLEQNNASNTSSILQKAPVEQMVVEEPIIMEEDKNAVTMKQLTPAVVETPVLPHVISSIESNNSLSNAVAHTNLNEIKQNAEDLNVTTNNQQESENGSVDDDPMDGSSDRPLQYATEGQIFVLGDNKAVLYHGDDVRAPKVVSEPDDFFEITAKDVESIYRDLRAKRAQLENQPLLTNSLRQTDQEMMEEQIITKYPATVVRIRFPDRFVLQGVFATADYVSSVTSFVKRYLRNPDLNFYLFKAPPKTVLDETKTLLQQNLLSLAIIYFGSDVKQESYIREDLYPQVSDPQEVFKNSGLNSKTLTGVSLPTIKHANVVAKSRQASDTAVEPLPESSQEPRNDSRESVSNRPTRTTNSGVVPKWFKAAK